MTVITHAESIRQYHLAELLDNLKKLKPSGSNTQRERAERREAFKKVEEGIEELSEDRAVHYGGYIVWGGEKWWKSGVLERVEEREAKLHVLLTDALQKIKEIEG
jgi:hypothetical protein